MDNLFEKDILSPDEKSFRVPKQCDSWENGVKDETRKSKKEMYARLRRRFNGCGVGR